MVVLLYTHLWLATEFAFTILLSGDVETNPSPPKYPCGECGKACISYRGAKASKLVP